MPNDQEYFKSLVSLLEADKQQMMLIIGLEVGLPILTLKDLSFGKVVFDAVDTIPGAMRIWLGASIILLFLAALCHWLYMRRIHMNSFAVARLMLQTGDGEDARKLLFDARSGLWAKHGYKFNLGMLFLVAGLIAYAGFVWIHLSNLQG